MRLVSSSSVMCTVGRLLEMAPNVRVWLRKLVLSPQHSWRVLVVAGNMRKQRCAAAEIGVLNMM
jgi:hypothetical protein